MQGLLFNFMLCMATTFASRLVLNLRRAAREPSLTTVSGRSDRNFAANATTLSTLSAAPGQGATLQSSDVETAHTTTTGRAAVVKQHPRRGSVPWTKEEDDEMFEMDHWNWYDKRGGY